MQTVQAPCVLDQRTLPRYRHGKKQRIEPGVIEPLTNVAPRREDQTLLPVRDFRDLSSKLLSLARCHAALKHDQVTDEAAQTLGEVLEVIASLREQDR